MSARWTSTTAIGGWLTHGRWLLGRAFAAACERVGYGLGVDG